MNYDSFIKRKASEDGVSGFDPQDLGSRNLRDAREIQASGLFADDFCADELEAS